VFRNVFHYGESRKKAEVDSNSNNSDDDGVCDDDKEQDKQGFKDDEIMDYLVKYFLYGDCLEQERILEDDGWHVKQAKGIRGYARQRTVAGIECRTSEVSR
jgi:hypothetical protein